MLAAAIREFQRLASLRLLYINSVSSAPVLPAVFALTGSRKDGHGQVGPSKRADPPPQQGVFHMGILTDIGQAVKPCSNTEEASL